MHFANVAIVFALHSSSMQREDFGVREITDSVTKVGAVKLVPAKYEIKPSLCPSFNGFLK